MPLSGRLSEAPPCVSPLPAVPSSGHGLPMKWQSYQCVTEGELSIDGELCGNILEFGFSDKYFFFFLRLPLGNSNQTMIVGPYFRIFVPVLNLLAETDFGNAQAHQGTLHTFEGPRVGEMDINWGRMAADEGEITRPVIRLRLTLQRIKDGYRISLIGDTGPVDPRSIADPDPQNMKACQFEASYLLERVHVENMLADHPLQQQLLAGLA